MTIQVLNTKTGEVRQWDYERPVTKRTLKTRIARCMARDMSDYDIDYFLLLPPQELIPGESFDLLPVFLKYSPVIAIPNDLGGGYIFILSKQKMKIFSLEIGDFVNAEEPDLQKPYTLMSVKPIHSAGFTYETERALELTRPKWDGKLMLTPLAYRNTIREVSDNLSATDEEMLAEAYNRLRLLSPDRMYDSLYNGHIPHSVQKKYGKASTSALEPCVNNEGSHFYNSGLNDGMSIAYKRMGEENPRILDSYYSTTIVNYKDDMWKLSSPPESEKPVSLIKDIEKEYDILVYYYNYIPEEYGIPELCMLYVGRDMNGWESARARTDSGTPDACLKNVDSGSRPEFGNPKISTLRDMAFRVL